MADRSSWWDGDSWEPGTEQLWVWDGDSWVAAIDVWVWNGESWIEIFVSDATHVASEELLLLDRAGVIQIQTFQQYTASESLSLLDRAGVIVSDRNVNKSGRELMALGEAMLLTRKILASESLSLLERAGVIISDRNVNKSGRELMALGEEVRIFRAIEVAESLSLLERAVVTTTSRNIVHTARELMVITETGAVDITEIEPVASNALASWSDCEGNASVECDTDDFCESIKIRYRIDSGSWQTMGTYNTTPNSSFGPETLSPTPSGDDVQFEIEPWSGNGATGNVGTIIFSNVQECGGLP